MNDDYAKTLVMDVTPGKSNDKPSAAEVAEKFQASMDEKNETSKEVQFTNTYSYLT